MLTLWDRSMFCLLTFAVCTVIHQSLGFTNVALNKTASQIDTRYGHGANLAVDGDTNQMFWAGHSCALTYTNSSPFWFVDLGALYDIDHVIVYKRMDPCCSDRLRGVELYVGGTNTSYTLMDYHEGVMDPVYTFQLNPVVRGRWVKINKVGITGYLSLCEVMVMVESVVAYASYGKVESLAGTGDVAKSVSVNSAIQCSFLCAQHRDCVSFNIQRGTSVDCTMCYLLRDQTSVTSTDPQLQFYVES